MGEAAERRFKPSVVTNSGMAQGEAHVKPEVARKPDECCCKEESFSSGQPGPSMLARSKAYKCQRWVSWISLRTQEEALILMEALS